jgi:hypothetical protein
MRGRRERSPNGPWESIRWVYKARPEEGDERDHPALGRPEKILNGKKKSLADKAASSADDDSPEHVQRLKTQG